MAPVYQLDQVFNEATLPVVTFVPPREFPHVRASLRTRGKHLTIIGPSGSGKSTLTWKALEAEAIEKKDVLFINGRNHSVTPSFTEALQLELTLPGASRRELVLALAKMP